MIYGRDYYEYGIETGVSNYQNYRWIPDLTIPMAMTIIDFLGIKPGESVLDFGCAKGYVVKALRMLNRDAWGSDISDYALINADANIRPFLIKSDKLIKNWVDGLFHFKYGICKDVLEHIPLKSLKTLLKVMNVEKVFTVVPLGSCGRYFAPANNNDITHIHCEDEDWWLSLFTDCGWICDFCEDSFKGIKDSYPAGTHLFTVHRRKT